MAPTVGGHALSISDVVVNTGSILAIRFYRQVETNLVDPSTVTVSIGGQQVYVDYKYTQGAPIVSPILAELRYCEDI
jgi:hypothetical protein